MNYVGASRAHSVQWLGCRLDNHGIMVHFLKDTRHFYLFQSLNTCCGAHPVSCSIGIQEFFPWASGKCMKLTTTLHLVLQLGMSGAKLPVPCMRKGNCTFTLYLINWIIFFFIQFAVWLSGVSNSIKSSWCGYLQCYGPAGCHGNTVCGSGK